MRNTFILTLFCAAVLLSPSARADEKPLGYSAFHITLADGSHREYRLASGLQLHYSPSETDPEAYTLSFIGNDAPVSLEVDNIRDISYSHVFTAVKPLEADAEGISFNGTEATLTNIADGTLIVIADAAGRIVCSRKATGAAVTLPLHTLTPGIYVLTAGNSSYKFIRK